jgi:DNA-binding response OmpR family regulator
MAQGTRDPDYRLLIDTVRIANAHMVILVVEDEAIIGFCLTQVLEEAGHVVLGPALSSNEALKLADANPPDVALVDIDLESTGSGFVWPKRCASGMTAW